MKIKSDLVRTLRTNRGWSQEKLSEECGLSLRTIQRLENGGNASIDSIRAVAFIFGLEPNELITSEENNSTQVINIVKNSLLQFADFSGTMSRAEYWWFFLFVILTLAISTLVHEKAYQIVAIILLLPLLSAGTRRLHDINHSGWWQLFFFVPFGQVVILYLLAKETDDKPKAKNLNPA
ncbi:MAG: hypothetical protein Phog2KO_03890 [Phototrophicaceae bacterium]